MSVTDIVYFCSVLQLSKQQKPQNSEADTWIIAKATRSICKQSNAETPKPPTYPFINLQSQRAIFRQKSCDPPVTRRIRACLVFGFSNLFRSVPRRLRFGEGYLRRPHPGRKRKKHRNSEIFPVGRKIPEILADENDVRESLKLSKRYIVVKTVR